MKTKGHFFIENDTLKMHGPLEPKSEAEAIELSIERWEATLEWHNTNKRKLLSSYYSHDSLCGLCVWQMSNCDTCALTRGGYRCGGGPYGDYVVSPSAATAAAMVDALKSLRPEWVKRMLEANQKTMRLVGIDWAKGFEELKKEEKPPDYGEDWQSCPSAWWRIYGRDGIMMVASAEKKYRDRIIACVNACKGMTNEELENGVDTLRRMIQLLDEAGKVAGDRHLYIKLFGDGSGGLEAGGERVKTFYNRIAHQSADILRQLDEYVEKK